MSSKGRYLILKRIRAGDQDILAISYGSEGIVNILVRDGFLNSHEFFGLFEPFNVVTAYFYQKGDLLIPCDVIEVKRLSYICFDFHRYKWACWIASFVLKYLNFYDESVFNLILNYLRVNPKGKDRIFRIKFKLDYLKISGLEPLFIKTKHKSQTVRVKLSDGKISNDGDIELEGTVLSLLKRIEKGRALGRIRADISLLNKAEELLDSFLDYHIK